MPICIARHLTQKVSMDFKECITYELLIYLKNSRKNNELNWYN